jgi:hypothetical protein
MLGYQSLSRALQVSGKQAADRDTAIPMFCAGGAARSVWQPFFTFKYRMLHNTPSVPTTLWAAGMVL